MAYPNNQLVTCLVMLYALARAWVATILEYASLEKRPGGGQGETPPDGRRGGAVSGRPHAERHGARLRVSNPERQHRQHYNVTFALLAIAGGSYALLQSLVAPALPDIQHALHTSESSVSWVLTSYLLSASVSTPLIGS